MSDDLRARIADAYDEGTGVAWAQVSAGQVPRGSEERRNRIDAILAALPEADRHEVAGFIYTEECPGGGSQYDWNEAARQADYLLSRYHLIRKADNDD